MRSVFLMFIATVLPCITLGCGNDFERDVINTAATPNADLNVAAVFDNLSVERAYQLLSEWDASYPWTTFDGSHRFARVYIGGCVIINEEQFDCIVLTDVSHPALGFPREYFHVDPQYEIESVAVDEEGVLVQVVSNATQDAEVIRIHWPKNVGPPPATPILAAEYALRP